MQNCCDWQFVCLSALDEEASGPEDETGENLAKKRKCLETIFIIYIVIIWHVLLVFCDTLSYLDLKNYQHSRSLKLSRIVIFFFKNYVPVIRPC